MHAQQHGLRCQSRQVQQKQKEEQSKREPNWNSHEKKEAEEAKDVCNGEENEDQTGAQEKSLVMLAGHDGDMLQNGKTHSNAEPNILHPIGTDFMI